MKVLVEPFFWLALGTIGAVLGLSRRGVGNPDLRLRLLGVARRVLRWGLVPALCILVAPGLTEDMRTALIAALVVFAGWFVTFLFQQEDRATDQIDLMLALRSEIWVFFNDLTRNVVQEPEQETMAELEADPTAVPFFPLPGPALVFDANAAQIARLPSEAVDEVVQFYILLGSTRQFAEELRHPVFLGRPLSARNKAYKTYFKNYDYLIVLARAALVALNTALGVPEPDKIPNAAAPVNRPGRGRSDPPEGALDVSVHKP